MPSTSQAISLGLLVLFVAFLFPTLITTPSSGVSVNDITINDTGESERVGDALNIELESQDSTTAFLNVTSLVSGNHSNVAATQGVPTSTTLDNQTVTITVQSITAGQNGPVSLEVRYPSTFAWTQDATELSEQLPLAMALLAFFIVAAFFGAVLRS